MRGSVSGSSDRTFYGCKCSLNFYLRTGSDHDGSYYDGRNHGGGNGVDDYKMWLNLLDDLDGICGWNFFGRGSQSCTVDYDQSVGKT